MDPSPFGINIVSETDNKAPRVGRSKVSDYARELCVALICSFFLLFSAYRQGMAPPAAPPYCVDAQADKRILHAEDDFFGLMLFHSWHLLADGGLPFGLWAKVWNVVESCLQKLV